MAQQARTRGIWRACLCAALTLSTVCPLGAQAQKQIDINRPRTPFDCDLPIAKEWYGSPWRCLAELCAGRNVYNEYVFDSDNRRRKNPCYGQDPTTYPER